MFGAIIGDTVGSIYEFGACTDTVELYSEDSLYTDDTVMTLAVAEILENNKWQDKDYIIDTFKKYGKAYPYCSYGDRFVNWLLSNDRKPYNSCGNGSAMRVSACGWYGNSFTEVKEMATAVTEVTHNHPEGIKGAVVTAECIYYARIGKDKEYIKKYIEDNYNINFNYEELKRTYYYQEITCQITVPVALYCFIISDSFEDCLIKAVSLGGDADTTAAIACSVAEAYYKEISKDLLEHCLNKIHIRKSCDIKKLIQKHYLQAIENGVKIF